MTWFKLNINNNNNNGNITQKISGEKNKKIEKKYFSMIDTVLSKKNFMNYTLKDNLKICLSEKNFEQATENSVQYFTLIPGEEPTNFINWLDFIYQYLYKENTIERYWASQMVEELDQEIFFSENKYLSEFFFEEFELENVPECLSKDSINSKKPSKKINFDATYLNVTQNLGGSFMTNSNVFEEADEANLKYKHFRNKVKGYINKFKQQILNLDHPINRVTQIFVKIWVGYAEVKIDSLKRKYKDLDNKNQIDEINLTVDEMTQELQRFVVHLQIALKLFYSRTINYSYFNEEKDELINLITTLLFRTGNIYNTVFDLYKLSLDQNIRKMARNFLDLKKVNPEELGIDRQYCLNFVSLEFQEEILEKKLKEMEGKSSSINNEENDIELEKKKIGIILEIVKDNKKKVPKFGDRELDETNVNLNYEENFDLIINDVENPEDNNKSIMLGNINIELGSRKVSLLPKDELYGGNNLNESSYLLEDNYDDENENDICTNENLQKAGTNKTMIIRTTDETNEKKKKIKMPQMEKIFNRISYTRTKNIEYLSYPYETAIQLLKQIKKFKTPFEKMMIFASISSEITECINDFWKDLSGYIDSNLLNLEIDQLMAIFIYIIIHAQIPDIGVHCKMIKSFTTCITKASMIGYYYSTVEASVQYIASIKNAKELIKENKLNSK